MAYISKGNDFEDYKLPALLKPYPELISFCGTIDLVYTHVMSKGDYFI